MIRITPIIAIDESEIHEDFTRASGPGGQNVNKVSTAVQLRFDIANSSSLSGFDNVRKRLISLAGGLVTENGVIIIEARRFRTQRANRQDALRRLVELVRQAAQEPRVRHKTMPTFGSRIRRLETKHRRAETKQLRRPDAENE
jgi:ribosome-associated protein